MDDLTNNLSIDTPENIFLDAEIAGFGSRFMAALIDYVIIIALALLLDLLLTSAAQEDQVTANWFVALRVFVAFALMVFYHLFFELLWNGQTPGKRWFGLRVMQSNGLPLTISGALIRNLVRLFDFLPLFYGVGFIVLFSTKRTQRLGDLAARTVVVRERRQLTLTKLKEDFTVKYRFVRPTEPIPVHIQIDNLSEDDRRMVVDFLRRRDELANPERVANMIAAKIVAKIENFPIGSYSWKQAERFLEQVARAFELAEYTREHDEEA